METFSAQPPLKLANPGITQGLSINSSGTPLSNGQPIQSQNSQTAGLILGSLAPKPTSSGGVSFNPSASSGFSTASPTQPKTVPAASLSSFIGGSHPTPNGGTITTLGGNPSSFTPGGSYTIDTSGAVPSNALGSNYTSNDLYNQHSQYQDYVNGLAQAQSYSPDYIQAYQAQQQAQLQGAQIQSNYYTGNLPGDTVNYAQGETAKAAAQNTLQQAQANIAYSGQQLARTGNIAAAQTQLQYNPASVSAQNAIGQYNALQQQYPNASIPEYNNSLSPALNQQIAQEMVANSPAYRAQFQSTYQTPGGGTGIYSKLDLSGLQQNQNGSYTLVPAAAAALGSANAGIVNTQLSNLSNIQSAIDASSKTLDTTTQFMNQYGLNQSGVSILSQIQNSTNKNLDKAGAVAGLNADLNALRADYAQYLVARGGSVAGTNDEANKAIPDTISPAQLQTLVKEMQQDGRNTADAVSSQVNQALQGISNGSFSGASSGNAGNTGNIYAF